MPQLHVILPVQIWPAQLAFELLHGLCKIFLIIIHLLVFSDRRRFLLLLFPLLFRGGLLNGCRRYYRHLLLTLAQARQHLLQIAAFGALVAAGGSGTLFPEKAAKF